MNENSRRTLYMIAGCYLVYLGVSLTSGAIKGNEGNFAVALASGTVFFAAGIYMVVDYIRYRKKSFSEQEAEKDVQTIEENNVESEDTEKKGE